MKKQYKIQLPKGKKVTMTNVDFEDGVMTVNVELENRKEQKYEPKDGDFCVSDNGYLFIFKNEFISSHFERCASCYYGIDANGNLDYGLNYTIEDGRHATAEEKAAFLERLEKEYHKRWNAEKKCLEDVRWRAKENGKYYYIINSFFAVDDTLDDYSDIDKRLYELGNYFKTYEAAEKVAEQIREIFKKSKVE